MLVFTLCSSGPIKSTNFKVKTFWLSSHGVRGGSLLFRYLHPSSYIVFSKSTQLYKENGVIIVTCRQLFSVRGVPSNLHTSRYKQHLVQSVWLFSHDVRVERLLFRYLHPSSYISLSQSTNFLIYKYKDLTDFTAEVFVYSPTTIKVTRCDYCGYVIAYVIQCARHLVIFIFIYIVSRSLDLSKSTHYKTHRFVSLSIQTIEIYNSPTRPLQSRSSICYFKKCLSTRRLQSR